MNNSRKNSPKKDAAAQMQVLARELKEGSFRSIYLFYGEESYLCRQCRDNVKAALIAGGDTMNYSHFDGENVDEKALMDLADTLPFFSEHRLIVVEDSGFFSSSHDELAAYIAGMPDTACLVFVEKKADSRTKMYKAAAAKGLVLELSVPKEQDLASWLTHMIRQDGKRAERGALEYFIGLTPMDMTSMKNEMRKLLDYTGDREIITREDIDAVCCVNAENRIFDMVDAIAEKNEKKALELYNDLVTLREPPMRILFNINSQFSRLYQIKDLAVRGYPGRTIAEMTGIREFIVKKNLRLCEKFDSDALRRAVEDATELEESVKRGKLKDSMAVEMMIVKYSTAQ